MRFNNERIVHSCIEVKDLLQRITDNMSDEAQRLGVSVSALQMWTSVANMDRNIPLALAAEHSQVKKIARWLCSKAGLNAVEVSIDESTLNGSVDDENLDIVAELGQIIKILKTSKNGKTKMTALDRYHKIEQLVIKAKIEIERSL